MILRNTAISSRVISILQNSKHPLSVQQILFKLEESDLTPNKTTIYRLMEKLVEAKQVTMIVVNNGVAYFEYLSSEDSHHNHHHHHFFCNECEFLYCLDGCHVDRFGIELKELLPSKRFKIKKHYFNLHGVCENCTS